MMILSMLLMISPVAADICTPAAGSDAAELSQTSIGIREAFARSDVDAIVRFHHPAITKSLASDRFFSGHAALREDLRATFAGVSLRFVGNDVESLMICGNTAVEVTRFTVAVTPKNGTAPVTVRGRAMIVYTRSADAPHGWLSRQELVQPAP